MDPIDLPEQNSIDIRIAPYFPIAGRIGGIIFAFAGLAIATVNVFFGVALVIGGVLLVTTHYRIAIDFNSHTYRDYTWILGLKSGEKRRFERIEYIFINKNKVTQTMSARVISTTIERYDYNGYLKFSETNKIHLRSDANKKVLVAHMQLIAAKLKCKFVDHSE